MLIRNLVENAVKYATAGGQVRVYIPSSAGRKLEITNDYSSHERLIAEELFEPFFRPDASRNSSTGGNGLGLAICRAIALANGWNVRLEQDDTGVSVIATFGT
jgi:signal transduction histidine kinase